MGGEGGGARRGSGPVAGAAEVCEGSPLRTRTGYHHRSPTAISAPTSEHASCRGHAGPYRRVRLSDHIVFTPRFGAVGEMVYTRIARSGMLSLHELPSGQPTRRVGIKKIRTEK